MKRLNLFLTVDRATFLLCCWMVLFSFMACQKEKIENSLPSTSEESSALFRSINYEVENGMLAIATYPEVYELVLQLKNQEKDPDLYENAYIDIGLSATKRAGDIHYTDHPICQFFEQERGYVSKRSTEEAKLFAELASGNEDISSIVDRPYLNTLLNQDGAIKIGNRIFKLYDSGLTAIIANSDWEKYNEIKDLPGDEIAESCNLRVLNSEKEKLTPFYNMEEGYQVTSEKQVKDWRIVQNQNEDGTFTITNRSFIESSNGSEVQYQWAYPDGTTSIGKQPNRVYEQGEEIKVRTNNTTGDPGNDWWGDWWRGGKAEERACDLPDFKVLQLGSRMIRFNLDYPPSDPGFYVHWIFGDGTTDAGIPVTHTYGQSVPDVVPVTCQIKRGDGSVACEYTKIVVIEPDCKLRNKVKDKQDFIIGGEVWRMDCTIWIDKTIITPGDVGSITKTLKHNGVAFFGKKTEQVWISLEGIHFRRQNGNCLLHEIPFEEETEVDSGNVQRNIDDPNDPRINPYQLWSTHKMKANGQVVSYTQNGGKLYLY